MTQKYLKNKNSDAKKLEKKQIELQKKLEEVENAKIRALADLQNFQRRETENKIHWSRDAVCNFLRPLLPRLRELEMSAQHTQDKDAQKTIENLFQSFEKQGFKKINPPKNTPLDPEKHEVLLTEKGKKGCIVQVLETGWEFQGRIITPAKVSAAQE